MVDFTFEENIWQAGIAHVAGVDEAGRGLLAGPVVAAAVVFPALVAIAGLDDSKKLSPKQREALFPEILGRASGTGISVIPHAVIDRMTIYRASMQAMREAVSK